MQEGMRYNFDRRDMVQDIEYKYCMQIVLQEQEPTVQGVQRMLYELYVQRMIKPEMLLMSPQDLEDMSRRFAEEHTDREHFPYIAQYFVGKLAEREMYPPFYGREIKQIGYPGGTTYIHPLPSLEHRVVIAGFMPLNIR